MQLVSGRRRRCPAMLALGASAGCPARRGSAARAARRTPSSTGHGRAPQRRAAAAAAGQVAATRGSPFSARDSARRFVLTQVGPVLRRGQPRPVRSRSTPSAPASPAPASNSWPRTGPPTQVEHDSRGAGSGARRGRAGRRDRRTGRRLDRRARAVRGVPEPQPPPPVRRPGSRPPAATSECVEERSQRRPGRTPIAPPEQSGCQEQPAVADDGVLVVSPVEARRRRRAQDVSGNAEQGMAVATVDVCLAPAEASAGPVRAASPHSSRPADRGAGTVRAGPRDSQTSSAPSEQRSTAPHERPARQEAGC